MWLTIKLKCVMMAINLIWRVWEKNYISTDRLIKHTKKLQDIISRIQQERGGF